MTPEILFEIGVTLFFFISGMLGIYLASSLHSISTPAWYINGARIIIIIFSIIALIYAAFFAAHLISLAKV